MKPVAHLVQQLISQGVKLMVCLPLAKCVRSKTFSACVYPAAICGSDCLSVLKTGQQDLELFCGVSTLHVKAPKSHQRKLMMPWWSDNLFSELFPTDVRENCCWHPFQSWEYYIRLTEMLTQRIRPASYVRKSHLGIATGFIQNKQTKIKPGELYFYTALILLISTKGSEWKPWIF